MTVPQFEKEGEITIFLSLLLSVVLSFILIVFNSASNTFVKFEDEISMDAALRSCFGEYHQELYKRYHLLYIDSSYRISTADKENVEDHMYVYMKENLDFDKDFGGADTVNIQLGDVNIEKFLLASDEDALPVYIQATEYMQNYGDTEHTAVISELRAELPYSDRESFMEEWDRTLEYVAAFGVDFVNPSALARGMAGDGPDQIIETMNVRRQSISYADIPTRRLLNKGNFGPVVAQDKEPVFSEYLYQMCGSSIHPKEGSVLSGELEYLLYGKESDEENIKAVVERLIRIFGRENLDYISGNGGMISEIRSFADEIVPPPSSDPENQMFGVDREALVGAVAESLKYAWAQCEAIIKVSKLYGGGRLPANNPSEDWLLPVRDVAAYRSLLGITGGSGYTYEEYIVSFFNETGRRILSSRFLDVVEMNIRKNGSKGFCVDGCIEYMKVHADTNSNIGKEYSVTRDFSYERRYRITEQEL